MSRIGLFGGTFNPVHTGHLIMAQMAQEKYHLDKVIFIPSYLPPHKKVIHLAPAADRYAMVQLAVQGNPLFEVSDFEIHRREKSYTVHTVRHFQDTYPGSDLYFIIGQDSYPQLSSWKYIEDIAAVVKFIVVNRPGYTTSEKDGLEHHRVTMPGIEISSSWLRQRCQKGKSIKYLVPDSVFRYIENHRLYQ